MPSLNYHRHRLLCKHFFAIFDSELSKFEDITELFLNHLLLILDDYIFNETELQSLSISLGPSTDKKERNFSHISDNDLNNDGFEKEADGNHENT